MTNYTKTTDFAAKDSLPSGDSGKIIRGTEFETEFDNIATAVNSKSDANNPTFTGTVTIDGLTVNGNTVLGNAATDTVTVTADIASNLIPSADDTYNLGASGAEWNDLFIDGVANIDSLVANTADINGGTVDGVTIGGSSAGAITGTTITGTSFVTSGNMTFGDGDRAVFGAGSDLQVFHDGNDSYIADNGTGDLFISGAANITFRKSGTSEVMAQFSQDGAASLYYDNAAKLATTSTGIDVTGTVSADGLTVQTAQGDISILNASSSLDFARSGTNYFRATDASGSFRFITGALDFTTKRFDILANGDLQAYEDTGTTPKFVWDASAERLGLGTSSPSKLLDVSSNSAPTIRISNTRNDSNWDTDPVFGALEFYSADGSGSGAGVRASVKAEAASAFGNATDFVFRNGDATGVQQETMRIDYQGKVGIGTSSPTADLQVHATSAPRLWITSDGNNPSDAGALRFAEQHTGGAYFEFLHNGSDNTLKLTSTNGDIITFNRDTQNVGIGTDSPQGPLQVALNSSRNLVVGFDTEGDSRVSLRSIEDVANNLRPIQVEGSEIILGTAAFDQTVSSEAMRITSSGTVLVGKTSSTSSTVGAELRQNGLIIATTSSVPSLTLNRTTSDGTIAEFRKDNTTVVGTISAASTNIIYGNDTRGLKIEDTLIIPRNVNDTNAGNQVDLGSDTSRFKDLYLSGGAYLGGVAAANKLDDYEEGTFTPVVEGSTTAGTGTYATRNGQYTKIGNVVHVRIYINMSAHTGAGNLLLTGLPFNAKNQANGFYSASIDFSNGITKTAGRYIFGALRPNTSQIEIQEQNTGSVVTAWNNNVALDVAFQAAITMTYTTA